MTESNGASGIVSDSNMALSNEGDPTESQRLIDIDSNEPLQVGDFKLVRMYRTNFFYCPHIIEILDCKYFLCFCLFLSFEGIFQSAVSTVVCSKFSKCIA